MDRRLRNPTLATARCVTGLDHRGYEVAIVAVKRTYAVSPKGRVQLAIPPSPIRLHDVKTSDEPSASLKFPHDIVPEKPGTDVVLVGTAHPPQPDMDRWDATLAIKAPHGMISKTLSIYGARVWTQTVTGIAPGPPAKARPTPLHYELSYGGHTPEESEERNPSGTGFPRSAALIGQPAPAIEDPQAPLASSSPAPAGFGPIHSYWMPRSGFAGSSEERHMPLPAADFDPRHYSCASPGLWSEAPLVGDEPVLIAGVKREGTWRFQLPAWRPMLLVARGGSMSDHLPHLDTFLIDADESRVELVWRMSIRIDRRAPHFEAVYVIDHGDEDLEALARHPS
jgi:hypothetical protein